MIIGKLVFISGLSESMVLKSVGGQSWLKLEACQTVVRSRKEACFLHRGSTPLSTVSFLLYSQRQFDRFSLSLSLMRHP